MFGLLRKEEDYKTDEISERTEKDLNTIVSTTIRCFVSRQAELVLHLNRQYFRFIRLFRLFRNPSYFNKSTAGPIA